MADATESPEGAKGNDGAEKSAADIKTELREAVQPLKDAALGSLQEQGAAGADRLGTIAEAIKEAASKLEQDMPELGSYVREGADYLEQCSSDIKEQKFDRILDSLRAFARTRPVAAFGAAAIMGFLGARFLKSEEPKSADTRPANNYPTIH